MTKNIGNYKYSKADLAGIVLVATIWGERLLYYIRSVLLRLPFIGTYAKPFIIVAIVFVIFATSKYVIRRIKLTDFFFILFALIIYLFHLSIYDRNSELLIEYLPRFLTILLPMYLLGVICDIDKCMNVLIKVSTAYVYLGVLYYYYVTYVAGTYEMDTTIDQMGLAYQYLPHVLLLLYATLNRFNVFYLIALLLGLFMIIGTGNRGALFLVLFYGVSILLFRKIVKTHYKIIGILLFVLLVLSINSIALNMTEIMGDFGLSVRSLNYFLEGEFTDSNGRDYLYNILIPAILNSPFFGYGLAGDRILLNGTGAYSHNIFIELIISFGPFFGFIIFTSILVLLYRAFSNCQTAHQKSFFFILLSCGFLQLFISNTFLSEESFYFLLGYSVMLTRLSYYPGKK